MIKGATLRLILLVSCAHTLVHIYELSLPSVEQEIAAEYFPDSEQKGKQVTGLMSNTWRFTWGIGALLAGWLVDRFGSKPLLAIYLIGCSLTCWLAAASSPLWMLFGCMFTMGSLASIYHPAALALISRETTPESRPRALGLHGIFGSAGIGSAALVAGTFFRAGADWRDYYWVLGVPGLVLGTVFAWQACSATRKPAAALKSRKTSPEDGSALWQSYFTLVGVAVLQGFIYSAILSFLPRYLSVVELSSSASDAGRDVASGNYLAGQAMIVGCVGQYLAGRLARPALLEKQLACITLGYTPFLIFMAFAQGWSRPVAAGLFALIHFMHQPIYNSLIAKYTAPTRRSLCYGFSFAMGLGVGGIGATFAGFSTSDRLTYGSLALVSIVAGTLCLMLVWQERRRHFGDRNGRVGPEL